MLVKGRVERSTYPFLRSNSNGWHYNLGISILKFPVFAYDQKNKI